MEFFPLQWPLLFKCNYLNYNYFAREMNYITHYKKQWSKDNSVSTWYGFCSVKRLLNYIEINAGQCSHFPWSFLLCSLDHIDRGYYLQSPFQKSDVCKVIITLIDLCWEVVKLSSEAVTFAWGHLWKWTLYTEWMSLIWYLLNKFIVISTKHP